MALGYAATGNLLVLLLVPAGVICMAIAVIFLGIGVGTAIGTATGLATGLAEGIRYFLVERVFQVQEKPETEMARRIAGFDGSPSQDQPG